MQSWSGSRGLCAPRHAGGASPSPCPVSPVPDRATAHTTANLRADPEPASRAEIWNANHGQAPGPACFPGRSRPRRHGQGPRRQRRSMQRAGRSPRTATSSRLPSTTAARGRAPSISTPRSRRCPSRRLDPPSTLPRGRVEPLVATSPATGAQWPECRGVTREARHGRGRVPSRRRPGHVHGRDHPDCRGRVGRTAPRVADLLRRGAGDARRGRVRSRGARGARRAGAIPAAVLHPDGRGSGGARGGHGLRRGAAGPTAVRPTWPRA